VNDVRVSKRLVDSPAVILESDQVLTSSMRKILQAVKREGDGPAWAKPDLEINPRHVVITRLEAVRHVDEGLATMVGEQVFDNALVAAGLLDDPRTMLKRLNDLLERTLAARG
jgi:molecular chaperone HtpG